MATHSANPGPQQANQATSLQTRYLCIIAFLTFLAMILPAVVFLIVFAVTKSLLFSIPSAIVPGAIGLALAFALKHMATRIFPKSHDEIEVDKINARNTPAKQPIIKKLSTRKPKP